MSARYSSAIFVIFFPAIVALNSCQQLSPPLVIPCYGHVDSISYHFDTLLIKENSKWSDITDAWVYLDNNPVGAFQMPCTFPMITGSGAHTITIYPGIMINGTPDTRTKYPFYTYFTETVNLTQGKTIKFEPSCTFTSFAHFAWMEYFSTGCSITKNNIMSDTIMTRVTNGGYPYKCYGSAILDSIDPSHYTNVYQGISDTMTLPKDGATAVYLEVYYNCNAVVSVGLYESVPGYALPGQQLAPVTYLFPTGNGWEKMYINLQSIVAANPKGEPFTVYFEMYRNSGTTSPTYLYLDDIKLID